MVGTEIPPIWRLAGNSVEGVDMSVGATVLTGVIAALAGGIGVVAGALVTNRGQDRHWLRNQQLAAYRDLLGHYANYSMEITRAHGDRRRCAAPGPALPAPGSGLGRPARRARAVPAGGRL